MNDLITVVVPVYNKKEYLVKCVDSIRAQTYKNLEILLIDDGSTDGSGSMLDEFAAKDNRIRVIHKKNGGLSDTRNCGIKEAKGKYTGFIDADDYIEKDMYENLYKAYSQYDDITFAQIMSQNVYENGEVFSEPLKKSGETVILTDSEYLGELLLHKGDSSFCSKLFVSEWIKKYSFNLGELNEDFELLLRMMKDINKVATVEKLGYNIVLSRESITRGSYKQKLFEDMMKHVDEARDLVNDSYKEHEDKIAKFELTQCLDVLLHIPLKEMNSKNNFYMKCKRIVKSKESRKAIKENPYFDSRQRKNLLILSKYPMKAVRTIHRIIMKLRGVA